MCLGGGWDGTRLGISFSGPSSLAYWSSSNTSPGFCLLLWSALHPCDLTSPHFLWQLPWLRSRGPSSFLPLSYAPLSHLDFRHRFVLADCPFLPHCFILYSPLKDHPGMGGGGSDLSVLTLDKELRATREMAFPLRKSPPNWLPPNTKWSSPTDIVYIQITLYGLSRLHLCT